MVASFSPVHPTPSFFVGSLCTVIHVEHAAGPSGSMTPPATSLATPSTPRTQPQPSTSAAAALRSQPATTSQVNPHGFSLSLHMADNHSHTVYMQASSLHPWCSLPLITAGKVSSVSRRCHASCCLQVYAEGLSLTAVLSIVGLYLQLEHL